MILLALFQVGFEVYFINVFTQDGKAEITSCANRVSESVQGMGVMRILKQTNSEKLNHLYPDHTLLSISLNPKPFWVKQLELKKWTKLQAWVIIPALELYFSLYRPYDTASTRINYFSNYSL